MESTNGDRGLFTDLCAKLDLSIGSVDKLTGQLARPRKRKPPAQPVFGRVRASVVVGSSGVAVMRFDQGGPTQGYFWYIRSIVIGGENPLTTAAGKAFVYVIAGHSAEEIGTLAGLGLSDWRDQATSLPNVAFYGRGELPLRFNERLSIVLSGATGDQQYVAAAQFEQFEEGSVSEDWAV